MVSFVCWCVDNNCLHSTLDHSTSTMGQCSVKSPSGFSSSNPWATHSQFYSLGFALKISLGSLHTVPKEKCEYPRDLPRTQFLQNDLQWALFLNYGLEAFKLMLHMVHMKNVLLNMVGPGPYCGSSPLLSLELA